MGSVRNLLCACALVTPVAAWQFTPPSDLEGIIAKNEQTLVACKFPRSQV
jgi:hypothetical protein